MLKYTIPILLLATSGLQAQRCKVYHPQVTIQLARDSSATPDPACVARKGKVQWCAEDGDWSVAFKAGTPSPFETKEILIAGPMRGCSRWIQVKHCPGSRADCAFRYDSQVNPSPKKDPDIEIEPGP